MSFAHFLKDVSRAALRGSPAYWAWLGVLALVIAIAGTDYLEQLEQGLVVTNMSNQVSWGLYIANFTFLVGVAAAAVLLVIPAYIFDRKDIREVVLLGDVLAIGAVVMAMLFVLVDMGRPERLWHMIPGLGRFNFPSSLLAWDVLALTGYLAITLGISASILYGQYRGRNPERALFLPVVVLAVFWAVSIHTITAFLYSANVGREHWHDALLAPKFIASAFCSGPALALLMVHALKRLGAYAVSDTAVDTLALTMGVALQVTLFFIGAELFTNFYAAGAHSASAKYLYFGVNGASALQPWIWSALGCLVVATGICMVHPLRRHPVLLVMACVLTVIGVWIEKGLGLVVPGYVPTPMGEVLEYLPNALEVSISVGIWAVGLLLVTLMLKAALPIETGALRHPSVRRQPRPSP